MTPEQIASAGSESAHQKAVFAFCAMAALHGFRAAQTPTAYSPPGWLGESEPVRVLRWLHAIPNGGARDKITAARMKAEGLRPGVADIFLPVAAAGFHGLYIEMKKNNTSAKQSTEQLEFAEHCGAENYAYVLCRSWQEAADVLTKYLGSAR